jgi:hypothetical protein
MKNMYDVFLKVILLLFISMQMNQDPKGHTGEKRPSIPVCKAH